MLGPEDISGITTDLVADPFMIRCDDAWYMFFEIFNKGQVGLR